MPSVRYYNQTAPFWDFIASMEEQGNQHPFFAGGNRQAGEESSDNEQQQQRGNNPWTEGWAGFPFGGPFAHRGRHGRGPHGRHGGPAPPQGDHGHGQDHDMNDAAPEKEHDAGEGPAEPCGPPPPFSEEAPQHEPGSHRRHGSRHGPDARARCGGRGRGGFGGRGRHGPFGGPAAFAGPMGGFGALAEMFQSQLFGGEDENTTTSTNEKNRENSNDKAPQDFKPEADVFDTPSAFIIHISLPGAKKEDVGVNWDSDKSELSIAGVVYRPGDEELLKTLALDERKVGVFERKVRLGSRANPAQVDVEGISAKLEDGILRVEVPKMDAGFVEVRRVDVE